MVKDIKPDIIVLDIMMPGLNVFEACIEIKKSIKTIIIMLTTRDDIDNHNGEIHVASKVNKGTAFLILLEELNK